MIHLASIYRAVSVNMPLGVMMPFSTCLALLCALPWGQLSDTVRGAGMRLTYVLFLSFALAASPLTYARSLNVTVVVSNDSAPYLEIAEGVASGLLQENTGKSRTVGVDGLGRIDHSNTDVIVAVGMEATRALAATGIDVPVLSTLIPKAGFDKIAKQRGAKHDPGRLSAVYVDQPIARQLDLIRLVLPNRKRVGVIIGPDSLSLIERLHVEARARGLKLRIGRVSAETELFKVLEDVLSETDALLLLPDSVVSAPHAIRNLLYTAYRHRVPVIGFSPAYVRAGALITVHSTPAQLARQVTDVLQRFHIRAPSLLPPQYPRYFGVAANFHLAHSLEITLESEEALAMRLGAPGPRP